MHIFPRSVITFKTKSSKEELLKRFSEVFGKSLHSTQFEKQFPSPKFFFKLNYDTLIFKHGYINNFGRQTLVKGTILENKNIPEMKIIISVPIFVQFFYWISLLLTTITFFSFLLMKYRTGIFISEFWFFLVFDLGLLALVLVPFNRNVTKVATYFEDFIATTP